MKLSTTLQGVGLFAVSSATVVSSVLGLPLDLRPPKPDGIVSPEEHAKRFNDLLWKTAMKGVRKRPQTKQVDSDEGQFDSFPAEDSADFADNDLAQGQKKLQPPKMPEKFTFTGLFDSIYGPSSVFDDQPLLFTFAVDGNDASISGEGSTLYFQLDDVFCTPDETEPRSFLTGTFQTVNSGDVEPQDLCFAAPPGSLWEEMIFPVYKSFVQFWLAGDLAEIPWEYAGVAESAEGPVNLWVRQSLSQAVTGSPASSTVIANLVSDGSIIYYQTRMGSGLGVGGVDSTAQDFYLGTSTTVKVDFFEYQEYSSGEDVPNAVLSSDMKDNCPLANPQDGGWSVCEQADGSAQAAAFQSFLNKAGAQGQGLYQLDTHPYPSSYIPYEIIGDQEMVMSLPHFVPPMAGRAFHPVRNQGICGSCYSFSAAHAIGSAYSQANPGTRPVFSNQQIMNCQTIDDYALDSGESFLAPGGAGCFGGMPFLVIDWLVATGSELPLITTVPYQGNPGTCDMSVESVQTGVVGWSNFTTVEEMKNALYYRGDLSVAVDAGLMMVPGVDQTTLVSFPYFLGRGLQSNSTAINHAVVIVGWGPCLLPEPTEDSPCGDELSPEVIGECWIVQNSWGTHINIGKGFEVGYEGFYFINSDPNCDAGLSGYAIIPIIE